MFVSQVFLLVQKMIDEVEMLVEVGDYSESDYSEDGDYGGDYSYGDGGYGKK